MAFTITGSETCPPLEVTEGEICEIWIECADGELRTPKDMEKTMKGPIATFSPVWGMWGF